MPESQNMQPVEAVVRRYLAALNDGKIIEALNAFSLDARLRDEAGLERRGIREIAAAFASRERPIHVDIENLESQGEAVAVRVRVTYSESRAPRVYRGVFRVNRNRIRSLVMDAVPTPSVAGRRRGQLS